MTRNTSARKMAPPTPQTTPMTVVRVCELMPPLEVELLAFTGVAVLLLALTVVPVLVKEYVLLPEVVTTIVVYCCVTLAWDVEPGAVVVTAALEDCGVCDACVLDGIEEVSAGVELGVEDSELEDGGSLDCEDVGAGVEDSDVEEVEGACDEEVVGAAEELGGGVVEGVDDAAELNWLL